MSQQERSAPTMAARRFTRRHVIDIGLLATTWRPLGHSLMAERRLTTFFPHELGFTHGRGDGNRLVSGRGGFPNVEPLDIPLGGRPIWVIGITGEERITTWVTILADGSVSAWRATGPRVEPVTLEEGPVSLPLGLPPLLSAEASTVTIPIIPQHLDPTSLAPPLPLRDRLVFIDREGALVFAARDQPNDVMAQHHIGALPDARILTDSAGRVVVLAGATSDRYLHGVLGDDLEAAGFAIAQVDPPALLHQAILSERDVIEGIAPIWTDKDGDGRRELIVTMSNSAEGGRLAIISEQGQLLARGPGFGRGGRWRHPLAVAPFGPDGTTEIGSVRTPHIGGVVEFSRTDGDRLVTVAEVDGYTSHVIGTRNLDMAVAGDFDGDGQIELLLPRQDRTVIGAIRRTTHGNGAEVAWQLPLPGMLSTNLAAVSQPGGALSLGAGQNDGVLRLWLDRRESSGVRSRSGILKANR